MQFETHIRICFSNSRLFHINYINEDKNRLTSVKNQFHKYADDTVLCLITKTGTFKGVQRLLLQSVYSYVGFGILPLNKHIRYKLLI